MMRLTFCACHLDSVLQMSLQIARASQWGAPVNRSVPAWLPSFSIARSWCQAQARRFFQDRMRLDVAPSITQFFHDFVSHRGLLRTDSPTVPTFMNIEHTPGYSYL
jgi:hypothetical protein